MAQCLAAANIYSMLFVYHRLYDLPVLIVSVIYCASRFRETSGIVRLCHAWSLLATMLALNFPYDRIYEHYTLLVATPVLRATALPCVTYLVLSAFGALSVATFLEPSQTEYIPRDSGFRGTSYV